MKKFDFKRSKVKIDTEEGPYEVRFPTMLEATNFDKALLEEGADYEVIVKDYFESLGLDNKGYESLEYWQVKEILAYFRDPMGKEQSAQK